MSSTPPEFGPDPDLIPTPARPGLYVYAPVLVDLQDDERRWPGYFGPGVAQPIAMYACSCGFVRRGTGRYEAAAVTANCHRHASSCSRAPRLAAPADRDQERADRRARIAASGLAVLADPQCTFDPDTDTAA